MTADLILAAEAELSWTSARHRTGTRIVGMDWARIFLPASTHASNRFVAPGKFTEKCITTIDGHC